MSFFNQNGIARQLGDQDEEQRDMIFLKFSKNALNMDFSVGNIMGAIMEILDRKESMYLSEVGIVEKICAMLDQDRNTESYGEVEEKMYKTFFEMSGGIQEAVGNTISSMVIKHNIRRLLLQGKHIDENVILNQIFEAQEKSIVGEREMVEGDSATILNPNIPSPMKSQDYSGPQSVLTTNMGSGMFIPQASHTYGPNHQPIPAKETGFGPQPPLQSGLTDPQPSTSALQPHRTNGHLFDTQAINKNTPPCNPESASSSNGSQNSSGSSMPLGASASTYQGPNQPCAQSSLANNHQTVIFKYQQCYKSLKDIDEDKRELFAGQMLCLTVYPNLQCIECGFRSQLRDTVHHEETCCFKNGDENTSNIPSMSTHRDQPTITTSTGQSSSSERQSNIAQSNSGYSGDINNRSAVVPIEEDLMMFNQTSVDKQEEEDFKLACSLQESEYLKAETRKREEMGACSGQVYTFTSNASPTEQPQLNYYGPSQSGQEKKLDPDICKICNVRKANRVLLNCKHFICSVCVETAKTCGVCSEPVNGCGLADLSFRGQRGVLPDQKRVGAYLCQGCRERLCDIVLIPCGHFVCDACKPCVTSDGCKICGQVVNNCARKDVNMNY